MRRLTIVVTVVIIAASLAVGIYFATTQGASALDKYIGKPVTSTDMATLRSLSAQPYGPAATSAMQSDVTKYGGSPFTSAGKPTIVFIGGEFCQYCAVERWALITALNRFGNFSTLHYMTSAQNEGDYATFTFVNSSYRSNYISFRPFEAAGRDPNVALQSVPANYTSVWSNFGSGFPFLDFGNTYVTKGSVLAFADIIAGKNWTSIMTDVSTSDGPGLQIREAANLITALICKVDGDSPAAVCTAPPIISETSAISGPSQGTLPMEVIPAPNAVMSPPPGPRRHG